MAGFGGPPGDPGFNSGRRAFVERMDSSDQMDRLSTNSEPCFTEGLSLGSGGVSPLMPVSPDPTGRLSAARDKHAKAMEVLKRAARSSQSSANNSRTPSEVGALPQELAKERVTILQVPDDARRLSSSSAYSDGGGSAGPSTPAGSTLQLSGAAAAPGQQAQQVQAPRSGAALAAAVAAPQHSVSAPNIGATAQPGTAGSSPRRLEVSASKSPQTSGSGTPAVPPPGMPLPGAQEAALAKVFYEMRERQAVTAAKVDWRLSELQQESKGQLAEMQTVLEAQAKELASSLLTQQQASAQLVELRELIEAQAKEIDGLRSQELHLGIRAIKESLETFDKMGSRRAQELQVALSELQDLVGAQAKNLQELQSQDVSAGLSAMKETLELQSQAVMEVAPQTEELRTALAGVRKDIEANAESVSQLRAQTREQHEERLEELRRLRAGMSLQQHEGLLGELDQAQRQLQGQTAEAATRSWQLERKQLQDEVARLSSRAAAEQPPAAGLALQSGGEALSHLSSTLGQSSRHPNAVAIVFAASAGIAAVWMLLRPRQAPSKPPGGHHHFGSLNFCAGPRAVVPPHALLRPSGHHRHRRRSGA